VFPPESDQIRSMMIVSSAFLVTLFPSGAAAQDTTILEDDRSPGKRKEGIDRGELPLNHCSKSVWLLNGNVR
jgi:hypothetical protein